ncbi:hypothetical protein PpBr36_06905 [Pyricularia pennisetigena]|uniref:hypothetical protein n=1 Tax=Pyricularia pennisetigena TaxID=1578925 RepID=UPI001152DFA6|nr:hypothetical protein PpBr36_06905 [Pyricularia pennisetigena]TLS25364.1 hypothetical protein PpBr36_06905 [Pyricularia pennisetigena]
MTLLGPPDYDDDPHDPGRSRKRLRTAGEVASETTSSYAAVRDTTEVTPRNPRRAPKASRACDTCKAKKARCSGTMPCTRCAERGLACLYDARYSRGRPPTPPPGPSPTPPPAYATLRAPLRTTTLPIPPTDGLGSTPGRSAATPSPSTGRSVAAARGIDMVPVQPESGVPFDTSHDPEPSDIPPQHPDGLDPTASESVTRRGSPELYPAEIGGQYVEQTSGLAFLHRAHVRMISKGGTTERDGASLSSTMGPSSAEGLHPSYGVQAGSSSQLLITAGDKPILSSASLPASVASGRSDGDGGCNLSLPQGAKSLMSFYFDKCVVTYRILHRQSVEGWLGAMEQELEHIPPGGAASFSAVGGAKAAVVLTVLAIAIQKRARMSLHGTPGRDGTRDEDEVLRECDPCFSMAQSLVMAETGLPKLESAQARLLQVLYLLQTSRVNQAWYLLGTVSQIVSAMGLHRKPSRNSRPATQRLRTDYIQQQCGRRTFWVLYTIDVYLSVVLGRPRYLHDDNIDQEYPDSVADEEMTPAGERSRGRTTTTMDEAERDDSPMEAVVQHAKLGRIIAATCREVYAIGPNPSRRDRLRLALGCEARLHEWRASLPPLLGAVRPSSLVPSFRRQAVALRLAHAHAIMHAARPFLLLSRGGGGGDDGTDGRAHPEQEQRREMVSKCLRAAGTVLELVDSIAGDESLFHAFWWSHYVTFCAIAVTFVWEIQQASCSSSSSSSSSRPDEPSPQPLEPAVAEQLFALAERCHAHLSRVLFADSFGRRYTVILEELRLEARHQSAELTPTATGINRQVAATVQRVSAAGADVDDMPISSVECTMGRNDEQGLAGGFNDWAPIDWMELDAAPNNRPSYILCGDKAHFARINGGVPLELLGGIRTHRTLQQGCQGHSYPETYQIKFQVRLGSVQIRQMPFSICIYTDESLSIQVLTWQYTVYPQAGRKDVLGDVLAEIITRDLARPVGIPPSARDEGGYAADVDDGRVAALVHLHHGPDLRSGAVHGAVGVEPKDAPPRVVRQAQESRHLAAHGGHRIPAARHVGGAVDAARLLDDALHPLVDLGAVADVDLVEINLGVLVCVVQFRADLVE